MAEQHLQDEVFAVLCLSPLSTAQHGRYVHFTGIEYLKAAVLIASVIPGRSSIQFEVYRQES